MAITLFPNGRILHNGVEVASPKMVQQWRLRVIESLNPSYVTLTDWEICDSLGSSSGFGGNMT